MNCGASDGWGENQIWLPVGAMGHLVVGAMGQRPIAPYYVFITNLHFVHEN